MLKQENLKFDSYEYLNYCNTHHNVRGVAVITDKQYIFYSQVGDYFSTHDDIAINIEKEIHPYSKREGWDAFRENNVYVFAIGPNDFRIDFPDNNQLSLAQASFISKLLEQVDKYNLELENENKKAKVVVANARNYLEDWDVNDTLKIREVLPKMVTKNVKIEEEKIIGKTLSKEEIKSNLMFYVDFGSCTSIKEIIDVFNNCFKYYNDSYYHDTFIEIFPDYSKLIDFISVLKQLNLEDEKVENVTFENVKEILYNSLKKLFRNKTSYSEVRETIVFINYAVKKDIINEVFPNFKLVLPFILNINYEKEELVYIDNLLSNVSSYEEISKVIFKVAYDNRNKALTEEQNKLLRYNEILQGVERDKNIISNKDELNDLINRRNIIKQSLLKYDSEIFQIDFFLNSSRDSINKQERLIEYYSSNLIKKVINGRKIKKISKIMGTIEGGIEKKEIEKSKLIEQISEVTEELKLIEEKFKSITYFDFIPSNEKDMQFYYNKSFSLGEDELRKWITESEQKINELKREIDEMIQSGLVMFDDDTLQKSDVNDLLGDDKKQIHLK